MGLKGLLLGETVGFEAKQEKEDTNATFRL
jgi:hypothetical protein